MIDPAPVAISPARTLASKVPEITALFWVIKVFSTGMGETFSDFLVSHLPPGIAVGGAVLALIVSLIAQFRSRRYVAWIYWSAVVMVSICGTMVADIVDFVVGIPLLLSTVIFAALLAVVFGVWYASEKTLSVHSITTGRREAFYWTTVMVTFALGTVAGDLTAGTLHLGYLASTVLFAIVIAIPALAHRWGGLGAIPAFWAAYVVTRPLGASATDWLASNRADGLRFGTGWVSLAVTVPMIALIAVLALRPELFGGTPAMAAVRTGRR
ncbi:putative membrane-anchored protein [Nocardia sp. GAS34]|uniref:COG4705 family protein n=1 Tax=unclassified Nocardia TaxID=2637762 RepID=UPI003D2473EB